jgi:hypothetical protein
VVTVSEEEKKNCCFRWTHNYFEIKDVGMGTACRTNGEKRNACLLLMIKPERKRPLGRPRRRWVDNIEMELVEAEYDGMDLNWSGSG